VALPKTLKYFFLWLYHTYIVCCVIACVPVVSCLFIRRKKISSRNACCQILLLLCAASSLPTMKIDCKASSGTRHKPKRCSLNWIVCDLTVSRCVSYWMLLLSLSSGRVIVIPPLCVIQGKYLAEDGGPTSARLNKYKGRCDQSTSGILTPRFHTWGWMENMTAGVVQARTQAVLFFQQWAQGTREFHT
jgi:hypothetical protein